MFTPSHFSIHLFYPHDLFFHSEGWILEPVFLFTLTLLKHGVMCLQWSLSAACHSSLWRSTTTVLYYSTVRKNGVYMDLENKFTTWVTFLHISGTLPLWNTYVSIKAKEKNRRTVQVWAKSGYLIKFPWILFFILGSAQFTSVDLSQELQLGRLVSVKWTWPFSSDYCLVGSLWVFRAPRWFSFADTEEMKHWRENDYSWGNCNEEEAWSQRESVGWTVCEIQGSTLVNAHLPLNLTLTQVCVALLPEEITPAITAALTHCLKITLPVQLLTSHIHFHFWKEESKSMEKWENGLWLLYFLSRWVKRKMVPISRGRSDYRQQRKWKNKMASLISITKLSFLFHFLTLVCFCKAGGTFKTVIPDSETRLKLTMKTEQDGESPALLKRLIIRRWKE